MPAGQLREKVTFQRQSNAVGDGAGNYGDDFADLAGAINISADLAPARQSEAVSAAGVQGRRLYEVTVRQTAVLVGITVNDIMLDARNPARRFNVIAPPINQDKHNRFLKILVEQGGANG